MVDSAQEIKDSLHSKSALSKFLHSQAYRRAARDAYRHSKVPFAHSLSYSISYYSHHSLHQREARAKWEVFSLIRRVQPSHVPEVCFTLAFLYTRA